MVVNASSQANPVPPLLDKFMAPKEPVEAEIESPFGACSAKLADVRQLFELVNDLNRQEQALAFEAAWDALRLRREARSVLIDAALGRTKVARNAMFVLAGLVGIYLTVADHMHIADAVHLLRWVC